MSKPPRTPRQTLAPALRRRLPKVGDEVTIKVTVTRVVDDLITVMIPANGQRSTAKAEYFFKDET